MSVDLNSVLRRIKFRLVVTISAQPSLYYGLRKITGKMDDLCVRSDTELVIEGYPRSANSTTVYSFLNRQLRPVKVAHHKHHAAQLLYAARHNIPAVLLIRRPDQAVLSYLALILEAQRRNLGGKRGKLVFQDALLGWLIFYHAVEHCADAFVIAPFEEVTQDIGGMIQAINQKFGTNFSDEIVAQEQTKSLGWHATPNEMRNHIKNELSEMFTQASTQSSQLRLMLDEANALHARLIALYNSQHPAEDEH